jgi:hypothetical protein
MALMIGLVILRKVTELTTTFQTGLIGYLQPEEEETLMTLTHITHPKQDLLIADFFKKSEGRWHSDRRYYTLPDGITQEVVSLITVRFLQPGSPELIELAKLHQLSDLNQFTCGSEVTWESQDSVSGKQKSAGRTHFGADQNILYRDRAFVTPDPIQASFYFPNPQTLCLKTEYNGSVFEEELKLIGDRYRTRQTIISRAGQQQTIGQYLEKRIDE